MKRFTTCLLVLILIITPILAIGSTPINNSTNSDSESENILEDIQYESEKDNVNLNMLFFTETPSSDTGFYYVCRRGTDAVAYFGESEVRYIIDSNVFTVVFPNSQSVIPEGENPIGSTTNYILGNSPSQWKTGIEDCSLLRYKGIYSGIDLVYRVQEGNLKYEFIVSPFSDPNEIQMRYSDIDTMVIHDNSVVVNRDTSKFSDTGLWVFQEKQDRVDIECSYQSASENTVGFKVGDYDKSEELVIDPILVYSSYLGGSDSDIGYDVDAENGYAYITGTTRSGNFPVENPYNATQGGNYDCFVTKIDIKNSILVYSTFLGGSGDDKAMGIVAYYESVFITGYTYSPTFPTVSAFSPVHNGGIDGFVAKLSIDGSSLDFSTFLGSSDDDLLTDIAVHSGYPYVVGYTDSASGYPTVSAYNTSSNGLFDIVVTKVNFDGQSLVYSTYLGGSSQDFGRAIDVDSGYAHITGETISSDYPVVNAYDSTYNSGWDCFLTELDADGQAVLYSTYYGGSGDDYGYGLDLYGWDICFTGRTSSADFPLANAYDDIYNGGVDCFFAMIDADDVTLHFSSYIGGMQNDFGQDIIQDNGYVYITGYTESPTFPTMNAFDSVLDGFQDSFVVKIDMQGSICYSTFVGGDDFEYGYGIDAENGLVYITGYTGSSDYPTVKGYSQSLRGTSDCFLSVIGEDQDNDGLADYLEEEYGTNPLNSDSDFDSYSDATEIQEGTDPLDTNWFPGATSESEYAIAYSSFIGGSAYDQIHEVVVQDGFIYLAGRTSSSNFPMVNSWNGTMGTLMDAFIVKMATDGQSIIYSTFVGGDDAEYLTAMFVFDGFVYLSGYTSSPDFPTYLAYDDSFGGSQDGFLFKLDSSGSIPVFSTFLGGISTDYCYDVYVDDGYAYVVGQTASSDFPLLNAYRSTLGNYEAFVTKFALNGQSLLYSTYLGGSSPDYGFGISVENGFAYVAGLTLSSNFPIKNPVDDSYSGNEGFLTKLSQDGKSLVFSTFLGGTGTDIIQAIEVDNGYAYVAGITTSSDFPLENALFDTKLGGSVYSGFLSKIKQDCSGFVYSTYITGSSLVSVEGISVDEGFVCLTGHTEATDFPLTEEDTYPCDPSSIDSFMTKFSVDGQSLLYSTCFGGNDTDYSRSIAVYDGRVYVAGYTESIDFPVSFGFNETKGSATCGFLTIFDIDSDFDALPDFAETLLGTDIHSVDSDGDNFLDCYEIHYGSDPLNATSFPAIPQSWFDAISASLGGDATLIQNLIIWSEGNASLLQTVMQQLDDNATLLTQVISWLDGNHTAIQTLFTQLMGNASLLTLTVAALEGNSTIIQNLLTWAAGNATLLQTLSNQVTTLEAADVAQLIEWMDGNHTAIEILLTYVEGNASLLLSIVDLVNENTSDLILLAALVSNDISALNALNVSHIEDIDEIRGILDLLGYGVGDRDYDGLDDLEELVLGTDILCIDTDCDNLNDAFEVKIGTDPLNDDSDGDSYLDGLEVIAGTDPLDALSYPGAPEGADPVIIIIIVGGCGVVVVGIGFVFRKIRSRK